MTMRTRRRDRTGRGRRGGYVMFEALAALALSGLVLAALPLASGILLKSWEKATTGSDRLDMVASGLSAARRELSLFRRERFAERDFAGPYVHQAGPDQFGFVAPNGRAAGAPGESLVMLAARPETNGNSLVLHTVPFRPDMKDFSAVIGSKAEVLMTGPWKYKFSYAGRQRSGIKWYDQWLDEQDMPVAVQLEVLDYVTGARVFPPLVVPFRITAEPGCIDEAGGECGV